MQKEARERSRGRPKQQGADAPRDVRTSRIQGRASQQGDASEAYEHRRATEAERGRVQVGRCRQWDARREGDEDEDAED
jgi:hypothetical protein